MVSVTLRPDYPPCPVCLHEHPVICSYIEKTIKHSVLASQNCILLYRARRYRCPVCHRTCYERNPFVYGRQRISQATVQNVLLDLRNPEATFSMIARRYNLSPTTVQNIFDDHVQIPKPTTLPRVLQMDETCSFRSDNSRYVCMLPDYDRQVPIDLLPDRKKENLLRYFRQFPQEERNKVKFIATDMYETCRSVCHSVFPKAVHACDRFHVVQEFTRQFQKVRIRHMKGKDTKSDEYYLLKHQNGLFNIRPGSKREIRQENPYIQNPQKEYEEILSPGARRTYNYHFKKWMNEYELLELLLSIDQELTDAYHFKNRLSDFFRENTIDSAPAALKKLISDMEKSQIPEIIHFASTLCNWYREIINSFTVIATEYETSPRTGKVKKKDRRLTSSMIENRNKYVQQIKNNANGYTNWTRFRSRVLYVLDKTITIQL